MRVSVARCLFFVAVALFIVPRASQSQTPAPSGASQAANQAGAAGLLPATPEPPTPTPFPQKGMLSRASSKIYGNKIMEAPWAGGGDTQGGAPISGSVSRKSDREWVARLYNNSEDVYSVHAEAVQFDAAGKRQRSDSVSARLAPKGSYERPLRASDRTADVELNLVSWKNLSEKARKEAEKQQKTLTLPTK